MIFQVKAGFIDLRVFRERWNKEKGLYPVVTTFILLRTIKGNALTMRASPAMNAELKAFFNSQVGIPMPSDSVSRQASSAHQPLASAVLIPHVGV